MNPDAFENLPTPDASIDPDLEVILSLLQATVVPAVTVLSVMANLASAGQVINQHQRDMLEDSRAVRQILFSMEEDLREAENLLQDANAFVILHNAARAQVWPVGMNGMRLNEEGFDHYTAMADRICVLIRRLDYDGMDLSRYAHVLRGSSLLNKARPTQWQIDLHSARLLQESALKAHTFGEKVRQLRLALRMCASVLVQFHRVLAENENIMTRQTRRPR